MTPQATALVRASWANLKPLAEPTARAFYDRLIAADVPDRLRTWLDHLRSTLASHLASRPIARLCDEICNGRSDPAVVLDP